MNSKCLRLLLEQVLGYRKTLNSLLLQNEHIQVKIKSKIPKNTFKLLSIKRLTFVYQTMMFDVGIVFKERINLCTEIYTLNFKKVFGKFQKGSEDPILKKGNKRVNACALSGQTTAVHVALSSWLYRSVCPLVYSAIRAGEYLRLLCFQAWFQRIDSCPFPD